MRIQSSCPTGMIHHRFEAFFAVPRHRMDSTWQRLNLRETFVKGQFFPFKVEFDANSQEGPFQEGELNIHHGPGLSVQGMVGKVESQYRDLQYFYGSYVLSFRLIRPVRLEFFREEKGIRLALQCYLKPWIIPFWQMGNHFFWKWAGIF